MTSRGYNIAIGLVSVAIVVVFAWPYFRNSPPPPAPHAEEPAPSQPEPSAPTTTLAKPARAIAKTEGGHEILELAKPTPTVPPSDCRPDEMRAIALDIYAKNPDATASVFISALDKAFGVDTVHADRQDRVSARIGQAVLYSDYLTIRLATPYWAYRTDLLDALRKRDPIQAVTPPRAVIVFVTPGGVVTGNSGSDIHKIIVERGGRVIEPLATEHLRLSDGTAVRQAYPCAAFAVGASVTITAIPEEGQNVVKTFASATLADMK